MLTTFRGLFATSLLLALASISLPLVPLALAKLSLFVPSETFVIPIQIDYPIAVLWLMTLISTFTRYGKRGLWLLIGFPLAVFWPVGLVALRAYVNFP
jgi:hypothetical protein